MWDKILHKWLHLPYILNVRTNQYVKKPRATLLFIHGIGDNGSAWDTSIARLPSDLHIITIDLLGFGDSPKPIWAKYNASTQARSVFATLLKLRLQRGPLMVIGHSLGSLVAVELAKKHPRRIDSLILCSPPFYRDTPLTKPSLPTIDQLLKNAYESIQKQPSRFLRFARLAMKYKLINTSFSVTDDNIHSYMGALEASIVNQTALRDALKLHLPTTILHGTLDPVVVYSNLRYVAKHNPSMKLVNVIASHEVVGLFVPALVKTITKQLERG